MNRHADDIEDGRCGLRISALMAHAIPVERHGGPRDDSTLRTVGLRPRPSTTEPRRGYHSARASFNAAWQVVRGSAQSRS